MEDINIKDMDIICYSDNKLLNTFKHKNITKLSDVINCAKLMIRPSDLSDTENIYQGFRNLVLYRYCGIPIDNNIVLKSNIIFDIEGNPVRIDGKEEDICRSIHKLGLNYWEDSAVRSLIKENNYSKKESVNLENVFMDILKKEVIISKTERKIVLMLMKKIALILESNLKAMNQNNIDSSLKK